MENSKSTYSPITIVSVINGMLWILLTVQFMLPTIIVWRNQRQNLQLKKILTHIYSLLIIGLHRKNQYFEWKKHADKIRYIFIILFHESSFKFNCYTNFSFLYRICMSICLEKLF